MTKPIPVQAFRLDQTGLMRLFGELEARIMAVMWDLHEATIHDVSDRLGNPHYLTVTTVMNRLVYKNVLSRRRDGKVYVYTPIQTRDQFLESVSHQVVQSLLRDFGAVAVNQFADAVDELSDEELSALEQAIERARRRGLSAT